MSQSQNKDGSTSLKNYLKITFKGIEFKADESTPATLAFESDSSVHALEFISYEETSPLSLTFNFTENTSLTFTVSDDTPNASLSVSAKLPEYAKELSLNFEPTSGYSISEKTSSRNIFNSRNSMYAFSAHQLNDNQVNFSNESSFASFAIYDPTTTFTFASLSPDMTVAQKQTYDTCIKTFREKVITSMQEMLKNPSLLTEEMVIAYIAEMASQNRYTEALNTVPPSFRTGNKRTYLSTPYFNNLNAMNATLIKHSQEMADSIGNAVITSNLGIFSVSDLPDYINITGATPNITNLLALPSTIPGFTPTVSEAVGILTTYLRLSEMDSSLAAPLEPVIKKCVSTIETNCAVTDESLVLNENETPVSLSLTLKAGAALVHYGEKTQANDILAAGQALISSALLYHLPDAKLIAELYPILVQNKNYPHFEVISRTQNIWAWTVADSITYTESNLVGTINIKFPQGAIHHVIFNGIRQFNKIEIYGLSYRPDPNFERYNSSGYTHLANTRTLLLKSRHKTETETVRLTYNTAN
ncbi:hypothetical protein [Treponema zioleckii]|uniref:hypothetical protein n=1 Tax=Treponema zioleckii TaxID=331680 RepID=UPI00168B8996|nr:hypothetical protein [Treponema zioleckii]